MNLELPETLKDIAKTFSPKELFLGARICDSVLPHEKYSCEANMYWLQEYERECLLNPESPLCFQFKNRISNPIISKMSDSSILGNPNFMSLVTSKIQGDDHACRIASGYFGNFRMFKNVCDNGTQVCASPDNNLYFQGSMEGELPGIIMGAIRDSVYSEEIPSLKSNINWNNICYPE